MTKPTLHGFPQSSYVWTARAALAIKGVDYEFAPIDAGEHKQPAHLARHPFGKVPSLTNPDLFETSAIVRWADAQKGGAQLIPTDPVAAAKVEQWISTVNSYLYPQIVPGWLFKYIFAKDGPDTAAIKAIRPAIETSLAALAERMDSTYIVGKSLTAADLFVGPMLFVLTRFDDGKEMLAAQPKLQGLLGALADNGKFMSAAPPKG